ncbi:MAG: hypothetical protein A2X45_23530 [Lentisphaerae bacterium GWF2_50_93]|nr:MAG: hypothetical protein A2X45_23530 [Lentisphaerae bacterium GWF2_50_93]
MDADKKPYFGFVGLHGGMFESFSEYAKPLGVQVEYINDEEIVARKADFSKYDAVFLQHSRQDARDQYTELLRIARGKNPKFRAYPCSGDGSWALLMPAMAKDGTFVNDDELKKYYNSNKENLRRFLVYALVKCCGRDMKIEPPVDPEAPLVYHPDKPDGFSDIKSFLDWASKKRDISKMERVIVLAHSNHLIFQQPEVVDALIREFEKRGVLAIGLTDGKNGYEERELEFKPGLVVHTCHGSESPETRKKLDVPHISSLFNKGQSMEEYLNPSNMLGLNNGRAHQIITQECIGGTQPLFVSATIKGGGSEEALTPVQERVGHLADRACAMLKLRSVPAPSRKVAFIYYDREMGKSELMRGTPTGMNMNAPRSMVEVLKRLSAEGYGVKDAPRNEDELLSRMKDHGRQVGIWNPAVLDRLARSGKAILLPVETYRKWYDEKVPEIRRKELEHQWGPPPGDFLVWENEGKKYIVIPRLDMGNVILLPQPLRGEAQSVTALAVQTHDKLTPPPHNYLATYFWLQEGFPADAIVHFGTHGSEFFLPGKADALVSTDWCDIIIGRLPNIGVWIINNLGESVPLRRRTYATIVDHLTPPLVEAELSDDLKNLQSDIEKWTRVEEGALKDKFAKSIGEQVIKLDLAKDLKLDLSGGRLPTLKEIEAVETHLETIANESVPVSLHIFGQVPSKEQLIPYYVRCAGNKFLDAVGKLLSPENGLDREMVIRKKGESAIRLVVEKGLSPEESLKSIGAAVPDDGLPKLLKETFAMIVQLNADLRNTGNEFSGLMAALGGRFVVPGPGNSPDRNPGSVPTGRNMFVVNPEEIPTPQSWEIGKQLIDDLLKGEFEKNGRYPNKVAFSLGPMSTYRDFGVIESQILYLMGVRPVWDAKRVVGSVELIPAKELGRPRVDVFIQLRGLYRDQLPTRMQLIDKAIRLISNIDEPGNTVRENTLKVKDELLQSGMEPAKAEYSSVARMFGMPPGQMGSSWYYYLVQKTGEWNSREDLMRTYLEHSRSLYTENHWGEEAPESYRQAIQGSEIVIRSWADSVSSPLSNKYTWYIDGSLSMAIKQLTGKEPKYYFADVRDPSKVRMVTAEDAINTDFHVRLFNRKWIEGMMKEGYAGADQVKTNVSNMLGWKIMREGSIRDDQWNEVVDVYVHDSKKLHVREWFDKENPHAFQNLVHMLMEASRKEYWNADAATLKELAQEYARSVVKYGPDGGIRTGGNNSFEKFLEDKLSAPGDANLLADYKAAMDKENVVQNQQQNASSTAQVQPDPATDTAKKTEQQAQDQLKTEQIKGKELAVKKQTLLEQLDRYKFLLIPVLFMFVALVLGFKLRQGAPKLQ